MLDFPGEVSVAVPAIGLVPSRHRPVPGKAGLGVVQHRDRRGAKRQHQPMAKKQIEHSEQTGVATQRPRRRGRIAAPPGSAEAPVMSPTVEEGGSDNQPTDPGSAAEATREPMVPPIAASGDPGAETETEPVSGPPKARGAIGNPTPRPNTKRAALLGLLERPDGASVAEIGQQLGWLPHTVRAAITGLRQAGHEVTRSRDENGGSRYRISSSKSRDG